jgi:septal ring factor EnvC (AmiA/AmiB activator)
VKKALNEAQHTVEELETANASTSAKLQVTEQKLKSNNKEIEQLNQDKEHLASEVEKEREEKVILDSQLLTHFRLGRF